MKCLICDQNIANQTGAHIFPAWMVASAFDPKARTRGHEVIYAMYLLDSKLPFFGNSVSPDKIKEEIGRDLTDEEARSQENLITVDNIWCRQCENRLKQVEDYFLENVDRKIVDFAICNDLYINTLHEANKYLIRLFLYSLILRASLARFTGFQLDIRSSTRLKSFINEYIKNDFKTTIKYLETAENKDQLLKFPLRCIKMEQRTNETMGLVFVHNKYNKPYCFLINRYIIQFYGKGDRSHFNSDSFFGISSIVHEAPDFKNYKEESFRVAQINLKLWEGIKKKVIDVQTKKRMESFILMFKMMFKSKFGHAPSRPLIARFLKVLTDNDLPLGIKYTKEKIVEAMNKTLKG